MGNICSTMLIMSKDDFQQIQGLFSEGEQSFERDFLDLRKITPLQQHSPLATWGSSSNTYRNEIWPVDDMIHLEFRTGNNSPLQALEDMARRFKISFKVYAIEGGCQYGVVGEMGFDDEGEFCREIEFGEVGMLEACNAIFGIPLEEYLTID